MLQVKNHIPGPGAVHICLLTCQFFWLAEEDVRTFKEAMGKTTRSVVVQVAGFVQKSALYNSKLEAFLEDAQGMLKFGTQVQDLLEGMPNMKLTTENLNELHGVMAVLPEMRESMRQKLMSTFEYSLQSTIKRLCSMAKDEVCSADLLGLAQKVNAEACIVWPEDAALTDQKEALALALGKASHEAVLALVLKYCEGVAQPCQVGGDKLADICNALNGLSEVATSGALLEDIIADKKATLLKAEQNVVNVFIMHITEGAGLLDIELSRFGQAVQQLCILLNKSGDDILDVLELAAALSVLAVERKKASENDKQEKAFDEKKAVLKLRACLNKAESEVLKIARAGFDSFMAKHEKDLEELSVSLTTQAYTDLTELLTSAEPTLLKLRQFYNNPKKIGLQTTLKSADDTILALDPKIFSSTAEQLQQVPI
eukprot:6478298-Amphidinium_carterae.2